MHHRHFMTGENSAYLCYRAFSTDELVDCKSRYTQYTGHGDAPANEVCLPGVHIAVVA